MYGGSGKLGRVGGGGRGGGSGGGGPGKRNIHSNFHPPPLHRPSGPPGGRLSLGGSAGPRNRTATSGPSSSAPSSSSSATEETFNLVSGNPLSFAMIIRLAPDLVEEIKRVEAQGGTARIKFDAHANNPSGNVIEVGVKDFRFTWSRETGDLCDLYEEQRSGDDGNGLLVESGCAWRKLNVQRILDESTKNHVKMRSEEAERKLKQRKAIVLDPGNPSMKSQMKALAAVEANPWRMPFKQKKEPPFKKRKAEPPPVTGPSKHVYKSGVFLNTPSKGRPSASPQPSPPEQPGAPASPFGTGNHIKVHTDLEDVIRIQATSKENVTSAEKEISSRATSSSERGKPGKACLGTRLPDLRSMLISLLKEYPKGKSLKALEKAISDTIPNSVKKIEPIIKQIATFQAPGRYILKAGVELESFKKSSPDSGSSPENNRHEATAPEVNRDNTPDHKPIFFQKARSEESKEQGRLISKPGEEANFVEKIEVTHHSPDIFGDKKISVNSEGLPGSSSDSGSDSDSESDSSDSGSDSGSHSKSRSRSKSRSPGGSVSGTSSDSESDASSNSKEASDEEVDILSDDDKETKPNLQTSESGLPTSPIPWKIPDRPLDNEIEENQGGHGSDVEIEKDLPDDDQEAEIDITNISPTRQGSKPVDEAKHTLLDRHEHQDGQSNSRTLFGGKDKMAKWGSKHELSDRSEKVSRSKPKRLSDAKHFDENLDRNKRFKGGNLTHQQNSSGGNSLFSEDPYSLSPNKDNYTGPPTQTLNGTGKKGTDFGSQEGGNQATPGKSMHDSQQAGWRSVDLSARTKAVDVTDTTNKQVDSMGHGGKYFEKPLNVHEGASVQNDIVTREIEGEDGYAREKKLPKNSNEVGIRDRTSLPSDSCSSKNGELVGKINAGGPVLNSQMKFSLKESNRGDVDTSSVANGRGSVLRRELSDLELGELREPLPDSMPGLNKQFERKSSFKQLENKPSSSDYWNLDSSKMKPSGRKIVDSGKPSPPCSNFGVSNNFEGLSKKKTPEYNVEDLTQSQHGVFQSQPQHSARVDHTECSQVNKLSDVSARTRSGASQGMGIKGNGDTPRKAVNNSKKQEEIKQGLVVDSTKESNCNKSNSGELNDRRNATSLTESNDGSRKRWETSSDENSCSYLKYEKEEPELKGPIKDFSEYKEYVKEYREKYESYCSLNKILESYRNEFQNLGKDLEIAKGARDMDRYHSILEKLKESYRHCGARHKRLKKIFVVLHEELKQLKQMIKDFAVSYTRD